MTPSFITTGQVDTVFKKAKNGDDIVSHYYVGRKDMGRIHLLTVLPEYYTAGVAIYVDSYGSPWVKGNT